MGRFDFDLYQKSHSCQPGFHTRNVPSESRSHFFRPGSRFRSKCGPLCKALGSSVGVGEGWPWEAPWTPGSRPGKVGNFFIHQGSGQTDQHGSHGEQVPGIWWRPVGVRDRGRKPPTVGGRLKAISLEYRVLGLGLNRRPLKP